MELQDRRASVESKRIGERERAEAPSSRAKHIGRPEQAERSRFVRCDDVSQQAASDAGARSAVRAGPLRPVPGTERRPFRPSTPILWSAETR